MPTNTKRQYLLEALNTRLAAITTANDFQTNAGQHIYIGETPALGPDDEDEALAIVIGDEEPQYQGVNLFIALPIDVQAVVKADLDAPWMTVEAIIGDIKRAVELEDRTLDGLVKRMIQRGPVRALPREPGSTTVGAAVTYVAPFLEGWGTP